MVSDFHNYRALNIKDDDITAISIENVLTHMYLCLLCVKSRLGERLHSRYNYMRERERESATKKKEKKKLHLKQHYVKNGSLHSAETSDGDRGTIHPDTRLCAINMILKLLV